MLPIVWLVAKLDDSESWCSALLGDRPFLGQRCDGPSRLTVKSTILRHRPMQNGSGGSVSDQARRLLIPRCNGYDLGHQRHGSAAAMTKSETFYGADPQCANMFPPQCGAGGPCGEPRLSSLSWQRACHIGGHPWRQRLTTGNVG
jgi:hypothetical protein